MSEILHTQSHSHTTRKMQILHKQSHSHTTRNTQILHTQSHSHTTHNTQILRTLHRHRTYLYLLRVWTANSLSLCFHASFNIFSISLFMSLVTSLYWLCVWTANSLSVCFHVCFEIFFGVLKKKIYVSPRCMYVCVCVECVDGTRLSIFVSRGGGLGSRPIFKKFNEPYAPS